MRIVFFGTPEWAVPSLDALAASHHEVAAAVSNPDRPAGRGYRLQPPPVKLRALELGLDVHQPDKAKDPDFHEWLRREAPEVCVVVAYGKILPQSLLDVPPLGFLNVHFSLLPLYRGAAPVQRAIMDGRSVTGVSIMRLTAGMDEGPVLGTVEVEVGSEETAGELGSRMAVEGARVLVDVLDRYAAGSLSPVEQDHEAATYAPKISPEEARIEWDSPARAVHDKIRGLNPVPGAWTTLDDERMKIYRARPAPGPAPAPGEVKVAEGGDLVIGAADGALAVEEAQLAGRKRMSGAELARGLRIAPGVRAR